MHLLKQNIQRTKNKNVKKNNTHLLMLLYFYTWPDDKFCK